MRWKGGDGYSDVCLHGEGVAIGCRLAFELSCAMGLAHQESPSRLPRASAGYGRKVDLAGRGRSYLTP